MNQPTLFGTSHARNTDPDTSKAAAESLNRHAIMTRCAQLHRLIKHAGDHGRTVAELVAMTRNFPDGPWDRGNTARRVTDLAQAGLIYDSRKRRAGPSGREAIVWVSAER